MAFGFSIFVLVYAAASFSGGHLNPAVTAAMFFTGKVSLLRAVAYIIAQLCGAMLGSALVLGIDPTGFTAALGAFNQRNTWVNIPEAFGTELILTALLVFIVFTATDDTRAEDMVHLPVLGPFAIGMVVFLAHVVAVPIDGCSINPARSFGTAVTSGFWKDHWIFWVGPLVGGVVAGLLYEYVGAKFGPALGGAKEDADRKGGQGPMGHQEFAV
jgi:MIP family channel proteins